jgi:polysaccharide chain length determinant protein (PEP-CTERM system associated)
MQPKELMTNELQGLIDIAWRRKWIILVPFVSIFLLVTLWALYQPNLFRSSSSMFVEAQEVPSDYIRSTVTVDIESRMRSINQRLTSRTKLLKVINNLNLYPELVEKGVPSEVLVAAMQKDLTVEIPNRRDASFFMVHFVHRDATKAMQGVSNLVSLFVEESLQVREDQAEGTTTFIEEELEKLKLILEGQEQAVQRYKAKYMGELPDQLIANLRMLDNLQLQVIANQESQRELDARLMLLEQEISRLEGELDMKSAFSSEGGELPVTTVTLNQYIAKGDALRQQVATMESKYTDQHPDLLAARRELSRVEDTLRSFREELSKAVKSSTTVPLVVAPAQGYSLELSNLRRQLNENKLRLSSLLREERDLHKRTAIYQRRVESAPMREQQITQLTRDYDNTKTSYEDLLNKKMEAQMSENLEKRRKGEKFQILDPANFPESPYLPNRPKIMAIGFVGGMGAGMGLAILLEALFPAFYSLKQLQQQASDVPIAFSIPYISTKAERTRNWHRTAVGLLVAVVILVLSIFLLNRYVVVQGESMNVVKVNTKGMM